MTSRERICAAMRSEDVDYLPCSIYFNSGLVADGYDCSKLTDKTSLAIDLGVDPFVSVGMGHSMHPEVKLSNWQGEGEDESYPILWQAWDTPDGRLTQAVRKDPVREKWQTIHWGDESASSLYKPLVETHEDIDLCRHLIQPMSEEDYAEWLRRNQQAFNVAKTHQLPVIATYGQGLAKILFMMGAEKAVYLAADDPDGFEQLAEMIHQAEMRNIDLAAHRQIDVLKRFGGYETCNLYNPEIYHRVCVPRLKREVEHAHSFGLLIYYRIVTGMEPLLETIADIGFDCIEGGEPRLSQCSLDMWHDNFSGKASSWTGISSPVLLGGKDPQAVRQEVRRCVEVFGKREFILGVTNSIRQHFPWENTLALIDEWKKLR